jgi:predicted small lipoprotein YifL
VTPHQKLTALALAMVVALSLGACGRRGPLEPPPAAAPSPVPLAGEPTGYGTPALEGEQAGAAAPRPAPPAAAPRQFPLDFLL